MLAGPSVGTFFAELGAEVIKVESPNHPDITRSWRLPSEDKRLPVSAYFSSVNYKKKFWSLDLTHSGDRQQLLDSVQSADLVLMNFKRGDQEKFGLTDDVLYQHNSALIIGKINGFGAESDRVAYDLVLQAESGIMSMNGTPKSGPVKMPIAFIDVLAAHHLKEGILIELLKREQSDVYNGKTITISLYDAAVSSLVNQAANYLMANHVPQRIGSLHPNIAPYGELFKTADHRTITFAIGSNQHFEKLCTFLEQPELLQQNKFSSVQARVEHRKELFEILSPQIRARKADFILDAMRKQFVPCGEVKDLEAVFSTRRAQNLVREEVIEGQSTKRVTSIAFKTE